jgi:hypothetical protein
MNLPPGDRRSPALPMLMPNGLGPGELRQTQVSEARSDG